METRQIVPVANRRIVLGALFVALLVLPLALRSIPTYDYVLQLLLGLFMSIGLAASWNIIGGYAGYISLGHTAFFALGAYVSATLVAYRGFSPFATFWLAGLCAVVVAILLGLVILRARGRSFIVATIALLFVAQTVLNNWSFVGGVNGLSLPLPKIDREWLLVPFYYGLLACAAGAVMLSYFVKHSRLGLELRAIAEDEEGAAVAGVHTWRNKVVAFALSAYFVACAGAIWAYFLTYIQPAMFLNLAIAANMVIMTLLGGKGTVVGPILGAVVFRALDEVALTQFGNTSLNLTFSGIVLIVVVIVFPGGIIGELRKRGRLPKVLDWD